MDVESAGVEADSVVMEHPKSIEGWHFDIKDRCTRHWQAQKLANNGTIEPKQIVDNEQRFRSLWWNEHERLGTLTKAFIVEAGAKGAASPDKLRALKTRSALLKFVRGMETSMPPSDNGQPWLALRGHPREPDNEPSETRPDGSTKRRRAKSGTERDALLDQVNGGGDSSVKRQKKSVEQDPARASEGESPLGPVSSAKTANLGGKDVHSPGGKRVRCESTYASGFRISN